MDVTNVRPDCNCRTCFAMTSVDENGAHCGALIECLDKPDAPCAFYQTKEQLDAKQRACYDRLVDMGLFTGTYKQYLRGAARMQ